MKARKNRRNYGHFGRSRRVVAENVSGLVLDTSHLDAQVGDDTKLREELLRLYAESLEALATALRGEPSRARKEAAHKLKGASLAVGAFPLALLCEQVENEACAGPVRGAGRPSQRSCDPLGRDIARAIEATRRRVGELLRSDGG